MSATASVVDGQASRKKLTDRVEYLFQSELWTDCRFKVGLDTNVVIFEGHRVFLALASPVFEAMLFGNLAEKGEIVITDVQPSAFSALLQYIYTDKVNLTSFDQVFEIFYVAKKYMVSHLVNECTTYMSLNLCPANVCKVYEFAKMFDETDLINNCMRMICEKTKQVLNERSFNDVNFSTILTIYEQDELNIDSELDLLSAITRYAINFDQEKAVAVTKLGDARAALSETSKTLADNNTKIRQLIMKIRFLTLNTQDFIKGLALSNLLAESEKYAILLNICSSESHLPMPNGFSASRTKRRYKDVTTKSTNIFPPKATFGYFVNSNFNPR